MKSLLLCLLAICLFAGSSTAANGKESNTLIRHISFDHAVVCADVTLNDSGTRYPTTVSGKASPAVLSTDAFHGSQGMLFQVPAGSSTQRFEYKLCRHNEPYALRFDNERFIRFSVKIAEPFEPLEGSLIFFQAWQGTPWGPPVMMKLTSGDGPYKVELSIRNTQTGPDSQVPDKELWSSKMHENKWYHFVVGIKPRITGNASHLQLWMNGEKQLNWDNEGNIGYDPSAFSRNKPYNALTLKFGMYQPGSNSNHALLFDEIRFASTYEGALSEFEP